MEDKFWVKINCLDGTKSGWRMWVLDQDKIVQMASKKRGTTAPADSAIDFVLVAGLVKVPQDLISCWKFTLIDFMMHYEFVRAAEAN